MRKTFPREAFFLYPERPFPFLEPKKGYSPIPLRDTTPIYPVSFRDTTPYLFKVPGTDTTPKGYVPRRGTDTTPYEKTTDKSRCTPIPRKDTTPYLFGVRGDFFPGNPLREKSPGTPYPVLPRIFSGYYPYTPYEKTTEKSRCTPIPRKDTTPYLFGVRGDFFPGNPLREKSFGTPYPFGVQRGSIP